MVVLEIRRAHAVRSVRRARTSLAGLANQREPFWQTLFDEGKVARHLRRRSPMDSNDIATRRLRTRPPHETRFSSFDDDLWTWNRLMPDHVAALLVEDDLRLAHFTRDYLGTQDVCVTHVSDGESALTAVFGQRFDVVVLDIGLPRSDGMTVCRRIREDSDVPIIMVTGRVDEVDRVLGLELGADDYVIKPFSPRELLARMRAVVRRDRGELHTRPRTIRIGALELEESSRSARLAGKPLALTTNEFDLLIALAKRPNRIFSREQLVQLLHADDAAVFDRAIDVQISRLRQKLATHVEASGLIQTVRGVGYMLGVRP
ncbi:MAG: response regulator transcription factor [Polyangiales bacterium]